MSCCKADRDRARTAAAMCFACRARDGETCRDSGKPCTEMVKGVCPRGRHPNPAGVVRWVGVTWHGVPAPIRWGLVYRHGEPRKPLAGCGCVAALKRFWVDDGAGDGEPSGRWDLAAIARAGWRLLA